MISWWRKLVSRQRVHPINNQKKSKARLRLEHLEDRTVPATFFVSPSGLDANDGLTAGTAFRTVQKAIDEVAAAADGLDDDIQVLAGTYDTPGVDLAFTIPSSANISNLLIQGNSAVYIPQNAGSAVAADVDVFDDDVTIDGFTFVFDGTQFLGGVRESAGILSRGQNLTVSNNIIEVGAGSALADAYALQTIFGSDQGTLAITNNSIESNNTVAFRSGGIYLNPGTATLVTVTGNTVFGDNLTQGIVADGIDNVDISNNTLFRTAAPLVALSFQQLIYAGPFSGSGDQSNVTIADNFVNRSADGGVFVANSTGIEVGNTSSANDHSILMVTLQNNTVENSTLGLFVAQGANDLTVDGGDYSHNGVGVFVMNTEPGNAALNISGLTLLNVIADHSFADGVRATNLTGTTTITGGSYSNNTDDGLDLTGDSAVGTRLVLNGGVSALLNGDDGLFATGFLGTVGNAALVGVRITGGAFNDNGGDGIHLAAVGDVISTGTAPGVGGVSATGNDPGVFINGAASYSDTDGDYSTNVNHGIQLIDIAGDVTLVRTKADDNDANDDGIGDGLNATDGGDADLNAIGGNLLVQGALFRDNGGVNEHQERGVFVESIAGTVTFEDSTGIVQSVLVTGNESGGVRIDDGGTTADFTNGDYSNNIGHGIELNRGAGSFTGDVALTNVNASNNTGADIDGVHAINLNGTTTITGGTFSLNADDGLDLDGNGAGANLSLVTGNANLATVNGDDGLFAQQFLGTVVLGTVAVVPGWEFIDNGAATTTGDGVELSNVGAVTTNSILATTNDQGILINTATSWTDTNGTYSNNRGHGISLIDISGAVTLTFTTANDNADDGLHAVDGGATDPDSFAVGSLTVSGSQFVDAGNTQDFGVFVGNVGGNVVFNDDGVNANSVTGNDSGGVAIGNVTGSASFTSTNGALFSDNGGDGINVQSLTTTLTVNGIEANNNAGDGLDIGDGGTTATIGLGSITTSFSGNTAGHGINLNSAGGAASFSGAVTITNVIAFSNSIDGVHAINLNATTTITNGTFDSNTDDGLDLDGNGAGTNLSVTTTLGSSASFNGDDGLFGQDFLGTVTITGWLFIDNGATTTTGDGIQLTHVGAVTTNIVTATGNDPGIFISDAASYSDTGSDFSQNDDDGIRLIDIAGNVTLERTAADNNDADNDGIGDGLNATLSTNATAIGGNLLVQGASFRDSGGVNDHQEFGVFVQSIAGSVTFEDSTGIVQSVTVTGNESDGVRIVDGGTTASLTGFGIYNNNGGVGFAIASLSSTFTASDSDFSANGSDGLELTNVAGDVALTRVTANMNGVAAPTGEGLQGTSLSGTNTITDSQFNFNNRGILLTGTPGATTFTNSTASNNTLAAGDGAGISVESGALTVNGGSFVSNNTATTGNGGGINITSAGTHAIVSSFVENNLAGGGSGGGINFSAGSVSVTGSNVNVNTANVDGGGINVAGGTLSVSASSSVNGNTATTGNGGGINVNAAGTHTISASSVDFNNATLGSGGGINMTGSAGTVNVTTAASVDTNSANVNGGGINVAGGVLNVTTMSSVSSNTATTGNGGGINFAATGAHSINAASVDFNQALAGAGGGINMATGTGTVNVTASSVFMNTANTNGGGVNTAAGTLNLLSASAVNSNTATTGSGGGINMVAGTTAVNVTGSSVNSNTANTSGGGINTGSGTLSVTAASTVSDNTATNANGGGINFTGGTGHVITSSTIASNSAGAGTGGGVNFADAGGTLGITTSTLGGAGVGNSAIHGGGLAVSAGTVTVTTGTISNNTATTGSGGGVQLTGGVTTIQTTSTVSGNSAGDDGGGINLITGASLTFNSNNPINNNSAADNGGGINWTGGTLSHTGLAFTGNTADSDNSGSGNGGGINLDNVTFTLTGDTTSTGNSAANGGLLSATGATAIINTSTVRGNSATNTGGGLHLASGTLNVNTSTVRANSAVNGGGVGVVTGTANIDQSLLGGLLGTDANTATLGGGLNQSGGTVNVTASTFSQNTATTNGGGANVANGTMNLANSTISGNTATGSAGGLNTSAGIVNLRSATIAFNTGGGAQRTGGAALNAINTIFSSNPTFNTMGGLTSSTTNLIGGNPLLAHLDNYGGPTPTHALLPGSDALDAGTITGDANDQRGLSRVAGNPDETNMIDIDIGAFESRGFAVARTDGTGKQKTLIHRDFFEADGSTPHLFEYSVQSLDSPLFREPLTDTVSASNPLGNGTAGELRFQTIANANGSTFKTVDAPLFQIVGVANNAVVEHASGGTANHIITPANEQHTLRGTAGGNNRTNIPVFNQIASQTRFNDLAAATRSDQNIMFGNSATFVVTSYDQEQGGGAALVTNEIRVSGEVVLINAMGGPGKINEVNGTSFGGTHVAVTTVSSKATFAPIKIYSSSYTRLYTINTTYKNPVQALVNPGDPVPTVDTDLDNSNQFRQFPLRFVIVTKNTPAKFLLNNQRSSVQFVNGTSNQFVAVSLDSGGRGTVRLIFPVGFAVKNGIVNQLVINVFDFNGKNKADVSAKFYDGPIDLELSANGGSWVVEASSGAKKVNAKLVQVRVKLVKVQGEAKGQIIVKGVTPTGSFGTFTVTAKYKGKVLGSATASIPSVIQGSSGSTLTRVPTSRHRIR